MSHIHRHTSTKRSAGPPMLARGSLCLPACPKGAGQLVTSARAADYSLPGRRARSTGEYRGARATGRSPCPLPARLPKGAGQLVTFARAAASTRPPARRLPPRQLGQPTGHRPPPPRAHLRASSASALSLPFSFPRHPRHWAPCARGAPGLPACPLPARCLPACPLARLPACLRACLPAWPRAPPTALLLHIPTDLDRATIVRANVPGSESRSGGGPLSRADRAPPTRPCAPANWRPPFVTRRRRARRTSGRPAARAHLGPPTGVAPWRWRSEGTGRRRSPRVPRERCLAPLQAPGAAGPVDGRCLPTNLAKDRADAQRLVATRLLDRLHDPLGHFSRLQRIHPRAR